MSKKIPYKDIMNRIKDDVDYIADEAYTKGYTDGRKQAKTQAELDVAHDIENVAKENYQKGLDDAWECARKINCTLNDGGIKYNELYDIFGMINQHIIMHQFSASEALEKIKSYEEEQNKVRVGDEVESYLSRKYIIYKLSDDGKTAYGLDLTGYPVIQNVFIASKAKKTGRHFDEIETMMEKMRE